MFRESERLDPSTDDHGSAIAAMEPDDLDIIPIRRASPHRLAELVHHLGDVPISEARRAVRRTGRTCDAHDPLTIVASALLQLRREAQRYTQV